MLIAAIVSSTRVPFRVFIYLFKVLSALTSPMQNLSGLTLHDTAQGIKYCLRCEIFGGYEIDKVFLPFFLLRSTHQ